MKRILDAWLSLISLSPTVLFAGGLDVLDPVVPLAPPGARTNAAYMTLHNTGDRTRHLIGVSAPAYRAAHLHQSAVADGIATMSAVEQLDLDPGQKVSLAHGGLHIMLMGPETPVAEGDLVDVELHFADGEIIPVAALAKRITHMKPDHGS